jgi:uncharacterized membrane protein YjgN (DUF898 family)
MENQDTPEVAELESERMQFVGEGADYFKIWIVNLMLTIVTLGFYSPWAKVRTRRYLFNSTTFRGTSLDYHAKAKNILIGRIIALVLFSIYIICGAINPVAGIASALIISVLIPFIITQSLKFNVNNTSYNNIRFKFAGRVAQVYKLAFKYLAFPFVLMLFTLIYSFITGIEAKVDNNVPTGDFFAVYLIMAVQIINFIYFIFMFSRIFNSYLDFFYNNIFYGGSKVELLTDRKKLSKHVIRPILVNFLFFFVIPVLFGITMLIAPKTSTIVPIIAVILIYLIIFYIGMRIPYLLFSYVWNRVKLENGEVKTDLKQFEFMKTILVNAILTAITLGLYFPWARIKMLKLKTESRLIKIDSLEQISAVAIEKQNSLGEELSDIFDFDIEIGL